MESMEYERRFLVRDDPKGLDLIELVVIRQMYLVTGSEQVRIREKDYGDYSKFYHTIKSGHGASRLEKEAEITRETYQRLAGLIGDKPPLIKECKAYRQPDGATLFLYRYEQKPFKGLRVAEVEFDSIEALESFEVPDWLGPDITHNKAYESQSMWLQVLAEYTK